MTFILLVSSSRVEVVAALGFMLVHSTAGTARQNTDRETRRTADAAARYDECVRLFSVTTVTEFVCRGAAPPSAVAAVVVVVVPVPRDVNVASATNVDDDLVIALLSTALPADRMRQTDGHDSVAECGD